MSSLTCLHADIKNIADPRKAKESQRFFKTGKGEYGEGDIFVGLTVPQSRLIAANYLSLSLEDIEKLLTSRIHEERLIALFLLIKKFQNGDDRLKKNVFDLYLSHTKYINNWDLVDSSAEHIVGEYLWRLCHAELVSASQKKEILKPVQNDKIASLETLAKSHSVWDGVLPYFRHFSSPSKVNMRRHFGLLKFYSTMNTI